MAEKYDAVVIGAGLGGLVSAALLANEGYKVALVEKMKGLGGAAVAIPIMDIETEFGFHGVTNGGSLVRVLDALGLSEACPMITLSPNFAIYRDGTIYDAPSKIEDYASFGYIPEADRPELMKILEEIKATKFSDCEAYDLTSWHDWVNKRTQSQAVKDWLGILANIPLTEEHLSNISAGEALRTAGDALRVGEWSVYPKNGSLNEIHRTLGKFIQEKGGDIFLKTSVQEIKIKKDVACGIIASNANGILDIDADIVVDTLPVWEVLRLVNSEVFPRWFVERLHFLEDHLQDAPSASFGITCVCKKPLNEYKTSVLLDGTETTMAAAPSYLRWLACPTNWYPEEARHGLHLWQYGPVTPRSYVSFLRQRPSIFEKEKANLWKEIYTMFPDFKEEDIVWSGGGLIARTDCTLKFPGNAWNQRIDVEAPFVRNLYFAGDTVRGWGVGMDSAASSAILASQRITGKDLGLWVVPED
ncbi:hypothetical protein C1878_00820 [Gordonibacter sp. 28C]|uniref:phytoene desaturase family protein n=1 Tax=Gordonibacter sp. 28C TaxID=2078569 RepID=UPI000DF7DBD8|nr:FAD-dependent oxidoreductase [Gordonibacter sp. 28C]RDB64431.1 hypothetical protein C1878_00820 [Gordonibacter sp. 28C]